jgi:D-threo-aldose 1-dehydrogenase
MRLGRGGLRVGPHAFGAAPIGNLGRVVEEDEWRGAVPAAWEAGVRYFDTAPHYGLGLAERRLGESLPGDAVLSTKVGRLLVERENLEGALDDEGFAVPADLARVRDYSRDGVLRSLEASLERLGLDRVDLVLLHDPDHHEREAYEQAFPALAELRGQGVVRAIGAGMNQAQMLARFVRDLDLDVVLVAGRYTLLDQRALEELLPACVARGVAVVVGGPFNSGLLADPRPGASYDYAPAPAPLVARAVRIGEVCARHGVPLRAAALAFPFGHPAVRSVLVGVRSVAELEDALAMYSTAVPDELWQELASAGLLPGDVPVPAGAR